jgi:hypothetical protein
LFGIFAKAKHVYSKYAKFSSTLQRVLTLNKQWFVHLAGKMNKSKAKSANLEEIPLLTADSVLDSDNLKNAKAMWEDKWKSLDLKTLKKIPQEKAWKDRWRTWQWNMGQKIRTSVKNQMVKRGEYRNKYYKVNILGQGRTGLRTFGNVAASESSMARPVTLPYRVSFKTYIGQQVLGTAVEGAELLGYVMAELVHDALTADSYTIRDENEFTRKAYKEYTELENDMHNALHEGRIEIIKADTVISQLKDVTKTFANEVASIQMHKEQAEIPKFIVEQPNIRNTDLIDPEAWRSNALYMATIYGHNIPEGVADKITALLPHIDISKNTIDKIALESVKQYTWQDVSWVEYLLNITLPVYVSNIYEYILGNSSILEYKHLKRYAVWNSTLC